MADRAESAFQHYLKARLSGQPFHLAASLSKLSPQESKRLHEKIAVYGDIDAIVHRLPEVEAGQDKVKESKGFDLSGRQSFAGCEIVRRLGRGSMGAVYLAHQKKLKRYVVLKVLHPVIASESHAKERFLQEGNLIAQLEHPNIVPIYDMGEEDGLLYIIMKYVNGTLLNDLLPIVMQRKSMGLSLDILLQRICDTAEKREELVQRLHVRNETEFFCTLVDQICDAVDYAHGRGVVHRDIKPANILVTPEGQAVLFDFGLGMDVYAKRLTQEGDFIGTPLYTAPEQFQDKEVVRPRLLDVYSLGVTLYECLTGALPYAGEDFHNYYDNVKTKEPVKPSVWWSQVPRDLETILMKAIAKDTNYRYASARDLFTDLRHFLYHEPIAAQAPNLMYRARKWLWRHKWPVVSALAALLALGAVLGMQRWQELSLVKTLRSEAAGLAELSDYEGASAALEAALEIKFDNPEVWYELGVNKMAVGRYAAATSSLREALVFGDDEKVYPVLGAAYLYHGKLDQARASLESALAFNPDNWQALDRLALIQLLEGQTGEAISTYERLRGLQANSYQPDEVLLGWQEPAAFQLALLYHAAGKQDAALSALSDARRLEPDDPRFQQLWNEWQGEGGVVPTHPVDIAVEGGTIELTLPATWEDMRGHSERRFANVPVFRGTPAQARDLFRPPRVIVLSMEPSSTPFEQAFIELDQLLVRYEGGTFTREVRALEEGAHPRYAIVSDVIAPLEPMRLKGIIFAEQGRSYIIAAVTSSNSFKYYEADIDLILDSVHFQSDSDL